MLVERFSSLMVSWPGSFSGMSPVVSLDPHGIIVFRFLGVGFNNSDYSTFVMSTQPVKNVGVFQQLALAEELNVSTAQRYASAAYKDGLTQGTIRDIASLATWGRNMQNAERDLHRWLPHAFDSQLKTHQTTI